MAALTVSVFFLLASTALAIDETQNTRAVKEERPAFQALPRQLLGGWMEFSFHLYLNEIFSGPDNTTETVVSRNSDYPNFGDIMIMDEPLWDDLKKTKLVARAQGAAFQANKNAFSWLLAYNIVFELEGLKGSTLQVMGNALQTTTRREWSIVGGTGNFTVAEGQVYGRMLSPGDETAWTELKIAGWYWPMQQPPWNN